MSHGSRAATSQHAEINHKSLPPTSPKSRVEVGLLSALWGGRIYDQCVCTFLTSLGFPREVAFLDDGGTEKMEINFP